MKFNLFAGDELLGYSELEKADSSMGIRTGKFVPDKNYSKYQNLFLEHSKIRTGMNVSTEPPNEYKELRAQIDALHLHIETNNREEVGTTAIDLEDFSDVLGKDGYELSMIVDDHNTYEKFFD